jgi:hypothetical protein
MACSSPRRGLEILSNAEAEMTRLFASIFCVKHQPCCVAIVFLGEVKYILYDPELVGDVQPADTLNMTISGARHRR